MAAQPLFQLEGYRELVKELKTVSADMKKELADIIREAVGTVSSRAIANIPHHTDSSRYANGSRGGTSRSPGGLAAGIKSSRSGVYGKVQSTAPYARVIEFGSSVKRTSRGQGSVTYALSALEPVPQPQKGRDLLRAGWDVRDEISPELTSRVMALMKRVFEEAG